MAEGGPLVYQTSLFLNDIGVSGVDDILNIVRRFIHFRLFLNIITRSFLELLFSLHLDHLSSLAHQFETQSHLISQLLLVHGKALQLDETNGVDGALGWHRERGCHLGQKWQRLRHIGSVAFGLALGLLLVLTQLRVGLF